MPPPPKKNSPWFDAVADQQKFAPFKGSKETEVVVIGGGIVGIMTAWRLAESGKKVVVLEKNHVATGDTGLTTAFLTRVPDTAISAIAQQYGLEWAGKLLKTTAETQNRVFKLIQELQLECDFEICNSFFSSYEPNEEALRLEWDIYKQIGVECGLAEGNAETTFTQAIQFRNEGKFHIRKFLFSLLNHRPATLEIFEESEVLDIEGGEHIKVTTKDGAVQAQKCVVSIGNPSSLFPELSPLVESKITYVLAAHYDRAPLSKDLFWDTLEPYFYYRRLDEKTLILGGCDIESTKTSSQKPHETLSKFLDEHFKKPYEITHQWAGSIFKTTDGLPYIFEHPHHSRKLIVATGLGGNGMVMGAMAADLATDLVLEKTTYKNDLFSPQRTGITIQKPIPKSRAIHGEKAFVDFGDTSEFEQKPMLCKTIEGQKILLFKIGGEFSAINNTCSHAGGQLCDGTHDGKTIECPLHGAKFDVSTGAVVGPPATRALQKYATKIEGSRIEVEVEKGGAPAKNADFEDPLNNLKSLLKFALAALGFWLIEFSLQYFWLSKDDLGGSLVRSFGLSGATFFSIALVLSVVFKWWPTLASKWRLRRRFGVAGLTFILFHVLSVFHFYFNYKVKLIYFSFNPLKNPIIFGSIAFPIFFVMAATSTDWAVSKLGQRHWKWIHRFVYIAYISSIFHFMTMNPALLKNPPGVLLIVLTAAALLGQLFWFIELARKQKFRSLGTLIGVGVILATVATAYWVIKSRN